MLIYVVTKTFLSSPPFARPWELSACNTLISFADVCVQTPIFYVAFSPRALPFASN